MSKHTQAFPVVLSSSDLNRSEYDDELIRRYNIHHGLLNALKMLMLEIGDERNVGRIGKIRLHAAQIIIAQAEGEL